MQHDLQIFLDGISDTIATEYKRIYRRSTQDPGTAGDQGEENWAGIIREWLPSYYRIVTKGRIINANGDLSPQIDVIVLHPEYPPALVGKKLYLSEGVAAAFECKNTLTAADIRKTYANARIVKKLYTPMYGSVDSELRSPIIYGLLSHSYKWRSKPSDVRSLIEGHMVTEGSKVEHVRELLDFICVSNLAFWKSVQFLSARSGLPNEKPKTEGWVCYTCTDRPGGQLTFGGHDDNFSACGPFISALISRMAVQNQKLKPLSRYFEAVAPAFTRGSFPRINVDSFSHLSPRAQENIMGYLKTAGESGWSRHLD